MNSLPQSLIAAVLFGFGGNAMATDGLPVLFQHYLNVIRGSDSTIQVQSRVMDGLDLDKAKLIILATVRLKDFGVWTVSEDGAALRVRITKLGDGKQLRLEFQRTCKPPDSEPIEFSGTTIVRDED